LATPIRDSLNQQQKDFHRKTAAECFNSAWDYLEKSERTRDENATMLHLAHASLYHWGIVGTTRNLAVGNWQLSRIYCAVGDTKLALQFAEVSLGMCESEKLHDVLPSAYEGMARALAVSGDKESGCDYLEKAKKSLASVSNLDKEDEEIYSSQIADTERMLS
jgi:cation transport regulator ChaB